MDVLEVVKVERIVLPFDIADRIAVYQKDVAASRLVRSPKLESQGIADVRIL